MNTSTFIYERNNQMVLHTSFPRINDLCCAICKTDFIEVHDLSAKSYFHWQTVKCRLLILLISDIVASPVIGTEGLIFVIMHKRYFETGKLERILRNFKLTYQGVRSMTTELYKTCLIYTIQTKIAPLWNKVGDYFIQGKEFYNSVEAITALKLDIFSEEEDTYLQLHPGKIKIPYVKLEDYLSPSIISHFLADPKGYIDLSHYSLPLIHVLPSTKKGRLVSVSKELPEKCVFKDYDQMRRHWKNMYGYSLPKNRDGILYYEIKFLIPRSEIFTYPNICIVSSPLAITSSKEQNYTIKCFLSDMAVKLPTVCGKELQIANHTPLNKTSLNTNLSSNVLSKNKVLCEHPMETNNSTPQLEFSTHHTEGLVNTSLETQLDRIHQIRNIPFQENIRTDSNNRDNMENEKETQCFNVVQNAASKNMKSIRSRSNELGNSDDNCIVSKEETISAYFKIQKSVTEQIQKQLRLKEKLSKAKSRKSTKPSQQEMDQNINIEAMAKSNQLDQVKNSVLSDWLKKHSILHNSKAKKTELIKKVLSHVNNTQILREFRT